MISTTIDPNVWHALPISVIKFKVSTTNSCQKILPKLKKKLGLNKQIRHLTGYWCQVVTKGDPILMTA